MMLPLFKICTFLIGILDFLQQLFVGQIPTHNLSQIAGQTGATSAAGTPGGPGGPGGPAGPAAPGSPGCPIVPGVPMVPWGPLGPWSPRKQSILKMIINFCLFENNLFILSCALVHHTK